MLRLILLLLVIALGADALIYSGAYTQAVYREAAGAVERISEQVRSPPDRTVGGPGDRAAR